MFSFLDTKIGLDIGKDSIKLIEIKDTLTGFKIQKNTRYKIRYDENGNTDEQALQQLLEKIINEHPHTEISVTISHDILFMKEIPAGKNKEETEKNIDLLILNNLPIDQKDLIIRYKKTKDKVLCLALDKSFYSKNDKMLNYLKKNADFLSTEPIALQNALKFSKKYKTTTENIAIINIGALRVSITLFQNGSLYGYRVLPNKGMFSLSKKIEASQQISFKEAELLRRSSILDKKTEQNIKEYIKEITDEIKYSSADLNPDTIILAGGGAGLKNLKAGFEEIFTETKIDTTPIAPEHFQTSKEEKTPHSFFTQALGLALTDENDINFPFTPTAKKKQKMNFSYMYAAAILALLLTIFSVNLSVKSAYYTKQINNLTAKMNTIFTQTFGKQKIIDPYLQMQQKMQAASGFSSSIKQIKTLKEIQNLLPQNGKIILTSLKIDLQKISLSGQALNYNSVESFKKNIKQSNTFTDISFRTDNKSKQHIEFSMKMEYR